MKVYENAWNKAVKSQQRSTKYKKSNGNFKTEQYNKGNSKLTRWTQQQSGNNTERISESKDKAIEINQQRIIGWKKSK